MIELLKIGDYVNVKYIRRTFSYSYGMNFYFNSKQWSEGKLPQENNIYKIIDITDEWKLGSKVCFIRDVISKDEFFVKITALEKYNYPIEFITEDEMRIE